ncbi:MAG: hypothetical protein ACREUU_09990, partial [Gammaproteobacteria bacterium]
MLNGKKRHELLAEALINAAVGSKAVRIAIFVREARVANAVAQGLDAMLKKQGVREGRICKITGRIRGYERDRLVEQSAFKAFVSPRPAHPAQIDGEQWLLVGTAAAEVGLDADADLILCDFAPLSTLLQRLGRLDRRGILSRRHAEGKGEAPTMRIFGSPEDASEKLQTQLRTLSNALKADTAPCSAPLMAGTHWHAATKIKDDAQGAGIAEQIKALQQEATWNVLCPEDGICRPPWEWLFHDYARVAAGPVVVPPVTDAVLDYWSATTEPRSPHLSPHPFLYGLVDDDESTPLVGIVFRVEIEALRVTGHEEIDTPNPTAEVLEIFKRFPP